MSKRGSQRPYCGQWTEAGEQECESPRHANPQEAPNGCVYRRSTPKRPRATCAKFTPAGFYANRLAAEAAGIPYKPPRRARAPSPARQRPQPVAYQRPKRAVSPRRRPEFFEPEPFQYQAAAPRRTSPRRAISPQRFQQQPEYLAPVYRQQQQRPYAAKKPRAKAKLGPRPPAIPRAPTYYEYVGGIPRAPTLQKRIRVTPELEEQLREQRIQAGRQEVEAVPHIRGAQTVAGLSPRQLLQERLRRGQTMFTGQKGAPTLAEEREPIQGPQAKRPSRASLQARPVFAAEEESEEEPETAEGTLTEPSQREQMNNPAYWAGAAEEGQASQEPSRYAVYDPRRWLGYKY